MSSPTKLQLRQWQVGGWEVGTIDPAPGVLPLGILPVSGCRQGQDHRREKSGARSLPMETHGLGPRLWLQPWTVWSLWISKFKSGSLYLNIKNVISVKPTFYFMGKTVQGMELFINTWHTLEALKCIIILFNPLVNKCKFAWIFQSSFKKKGNFMV